jgi:hypothetical protein
VLRIEPRADGTPLVVEVRSLTAPPAEVDCVLASTDVKFPKKGTP